ncbi:MAG: ATP-binding protein [Balneolaceae bacterium]
MHAFKMKDLNKDNSAKLNQQLIAEKNFSESILANIREPLLVLDKDLRVLTANRAFFKLFKVKESETLGVRIYDLGNTDWDVPELRTLLEKIIPEKSIIQDCQITHTFPKIGELILRVNAREVKSEHISQKLILLSIEDVTEKEKEKKKNKEFQEQYTKDLEDQIKARTIELRNANHELTLKNENLIKMNTELEAFAYVSSHDLQEPLRKIRTLASRLVDIENDNLSEKGHFYFNLMQDSAGRMQTLISDLLSFSKLNNVEKKFDNTDLNTLIEEVQSNLSCLIKEKNATIEVSEFCDVDVIVFQFKQLISNLITNAIKFSKPEVPPRIVIDCENKKGKDLKLDSLIPDIEYCHITFSDNGIGFEEQYNEKIFEVFQRLHQKEDYPGTGIGLATVRKIVNNHSGKITASGQLGKGSTFDIYLPVINRPEN